MTQIIPRSLHDSVPPKKGPVASLVLLINNPTMQNMYKKTVSLTVIMILLCPSTGSSDFRHGSSVVSPYASLNRHGVYLVVFLLGLYYAAILLFSRFGFGFLVVDCLCISSCSRSRSCSVLVSVCDTVLMPGIVTHVYFISFLFWE